MEETQAHQLLETTIGHARDAISKISAAFRQQWNNNPGTGARAAFGFWANRAVRHLAAITILVESGDLAIIAGVHYRQMFEILLQVRYLASAGLDERERLAQKISAWGCIEWLEKMEPFKNYEFAEQGYREINEQLGKYDPQLIEQVKDDLSHRIWYWFGKSFSQLADKVNRHGEDLNKLYHITSAQLHGAWDMTLGVTSPRSGVLEFREYSNETELYSRAAELVNLATDLSIQIWNEISDASGAPRVSLTK